jgi:hypothetical protein
LACARRARLSASATCACAACAAWRARAAALRAASARWRRSTGSISASSWPARHPVALVDQHLQQPARLDRSDRIGVLRFDRADAVHRRD